MLKKNIRIIIAVRVVLLSKAGKNSSYTNHVTMNCLRRNNSTMISVHRITKREIPSVGKLFVILDHMTPHKILLNRMDFNSGSQTRVLKRLVTEISITSDDKSVNSQVEPLPESNISNFPEQVNRVQTNVCACGLSYESRNSLIRHARKKHTNKFCGICNMTFENWKQFFAHKPVHDGLLKDSAHSEPVMNQKSGILGRSLGRRNCDSKAHDNSQGLVESLDYNIVSGTRNRVAMETETSVIPIDAGDGNPILRVNREKNDTLIFQTNTDNSMTKSESEKIGIGKYCHSG